MKKSLLLLLLWLLVSLPSFAQNKVPLEATLAENAPKTLGEVNAENVQSKVAVALKIVMATSPQKDNLFEWNGPSECLRGKKVLLRVTTSRDLVIQEKKVPDSLDSLVTVEPGEDDTAEQIIVVHLLADRLFWDATPASRPDGLSRTITALSRHLFGTVQEYLEMDPEKLKGQHTEIPSHQAGIDGLERIMKSPQFIELSAPLRQGLAKALLREKEGVDSQKKVQQKQQAP